MSLGLSARRVSLQQRTAIASSLRRCYSDLKQEYLSNFPEVVKRPRLIGKEAEFPVVDPTGASGDVQVRVEDRTAARNLGKTPEMILIAIPRGAQRLLHQVYSRLSQKDSENTVISYEDMSGDEPPRISSVKTAHAEYTIEVGTGTVEVRSLPTACLISSMPSLLLLWVRLQNSVHDFAAKHPSSHSPSAMSVKLSGLTASTL